jgi:prophage regulatory protein
MPSRRKTKLTDDNADVLLDFAEVQRRTTLSRTTVWRLERGGHFPPSIKLSPSRIAWREKDITAWLLRRAANTGAYVAD